VLFEIELWRSIQKYREADEAKVMEILLHNTYFLLLGLMDERYAGAVECCLKGVLALACGLIVRIWKSYFGLWVVKELGSCHT
jgi:hypothetical protein